MTYKSFLKSIGINKVGGLLTRVSPGLGVRLRYLVNYGKLPNLRSPKTFDEKIHWLKLHVIRYDPIYRICADKYLVRDYIKSIGSSEYLMISLPFTIMLKTLIGVISLLALQ